MLFVLFQRSFELDARLAGHTCTVVGSRVFLIGGHTPSDGLSEFMYILNMEDERFYAAKFDKLQPVGERLTLNEHVIIILLLALELCDPRIRLLTGWSGVLSPGVRKDQNNEDC